MKKDRQSDPQRINLYIYVRNNPLLYTDISGLDLQIRAKTEADAKKHFQIYQKGFNPKDRNKVTLVVGDGKNGYKVGEYAVQIDKKAKGKDDNFKAAQQLANSKNTTIISVVNPKDGADYQMPVPDLKKNDGSYTTEKNNMGVDAGQGLPGYTFSPLIGAPNPQELGYSNSNAIEVFVSSNQTDEEISATMHHESGVHAVDTDNAITNGTQPYPPSGHSPQFNVDNKPRNNVDQRAVDFEDRVRKNFKKP